MTAKDKAKKIKMLITDVDGVLTDGKMFMMPRPDGQSAELKGFNATDGIGIILLRRFGIIIGIITGRTSQANQERARALGIKYVYQGFVSKVKPFEEILKDSGLKPEEIAYVGDDLPDVPVMRMCGLACAPKNAAAEVKSEADFISKKCGGDGAMREICEFILKNKGLWPDVMELVDNADWDTAPKEEVKIVNA